jgi:hypothetical protein
MSAVQPSSSFAVASAPLASSCWQLRSILYDHRDYAGRLASHRCRLGQAQPARLQRPSSHADDQQQGEEGHEGEEGFPTPATHHSRTAIVDITQSFPSLVKMFLNRTNIPRPIRVISPKAVLISLV